MKLKFQNLNLHHAQKMNFWRKIPKDFDYQIARVCKHCENTFQGKFCNHCGEKVLEKQDQTFKNYLLNLLNAYTFVDGKFFNSIWTLLRKPGKLTSDISDGITVPYMQPISFFFLANFIYFFFPVIQTFNTNLFNQLNSMPYSGFAREKVNEFLINNDINLTEFSTVYDLNSTGNSKLLLFLFVLYLLPFIILTNFSKQVTFVKYFQLSLEFVTFILIVPTVGISLLTAGLGKILQAINSDWNVEVGDAYYSLFLAFIILCFFVPAIRRVVGFSWWRSILGGFLLVSSLIVVITIYRFTLFIATFYSL
ncbi:DUF3667 domain-containing protein [Algoriphagus lacus]|uniref:DUF3667 domain-containing protein n=2 Tax=Algoriphagus lacus TaxID=2056311 RepID=A0A418PS05_9BACT|nr:DUF3667 domain-containing protein [Algoriphagus lacus]